MHNKWVRVHSPEDADIRQLVEEFHLEEGPIRDALDPFEVPRVEVNDGIVYFYTRVPYQENEDRIVTIPLLIVVAPKHIVTV